MNTLLPESSIHLKFCLYLSVQVQANSSAIQAIEELKKLGYVVELEIVDVSMDPERAEVDRIIATPTLSKLQPEPMRRVMGDMSNIPLLLQLLQIS